MKFKEMNLPNKLTTLRMICVPFMVILFIIYMLFMNLNIQCDYIIFIKNGYSFLTISQLLMAILFILASITDFIDGYLARKNNIVSDFGKLMDPLADKLLVNTTLICMMASNMFFIGQHSFLTFEIFAIVMAVLVIGRDIFVDALRMQALKKNAVVPATIWGKLKTATLMPGIVFMILGSMHSIILLIGLTLISLGGFFAIFGGIKYFMDMKQYIED